MTNTLKPGERHLGVDIVKAFRIQDGGCGWFLVVSKGDPVNFEGDALVNAAKQGCQNDDSGIDGAITNAGGDALKRAREELKASSSFNTDTDTGQAVITIGGNLKVRNVIHAIGPNYGGMQRRLGKLSKNDCDELLRKAYKNAMKRAEELNCQSVGFSLLCAGAFRSDQTLEDVFAKGIETIVTSGYSALEEVHLIAYVPPNDDATEWQTLLQTCETVLANPMLNTEMLKAGEGNSLRAVDGKTIHEANSVDAVPLVIGIVGPSGCGKSTLAAALSRSFAGKYVPEDSAHFILPYASYTERDARYESPSNVSWEAAGAALTSAVACAKIDGAELGRPSLVFVEHFLLLCEESSLLPLVHRCIALDPCLALSDLGARDLCRERRVGRSERSCTENVALRKYYDEVVWPHYKRYTTARLENAFPNEHILRLDATRPASELLDDARTMVNLWMSELERASMML